MALLQDRGTGVGARSYVLLGWTDGPRERNSPAPRPARPSARARPKGDGYSVRSASHKSGFAVGFIAFRPWRPSV
jgi:hypothetical protein